MKRMEMARSRTARTWRRCALAAALLVSGAAISALASDAGAPVPGRFPLAAVRFEQNATDGDVEVVFKVKGRNEGLAKLSVVSPDGRTVIDFAAPGASALGIREFVFESPEPTDVEGLKAAYPAGVYRFAGATAAGQQLNGESTLAHELPATTSFVRPGVGARNVPVGDMQIAWTPVAKVSGYIIEIEHPMALVILGGLATSTLLNLFVIPPLYLRFARQDALAPGKVQHG